MYVWVFLDVVCDISSHSLGSGRKVWCLWSDVSICLRLMHVVVDDGLLLGLGLFLRRSLPVRLHGPVDRRLGVATVPSSALALERLAFDRPELFPIVEPESMFKSTNVSQKKRFSSI